MDGISVFVTAAASEAYDKTDKRGDLPNCLNFIGTYQTSLRLKVTTKARQKTTKGGGFCRNRYDKSRLTKRLKRR